MSTFHTRKVLRAGIHTELSLCVLMVQISAFHASTGLCVGTPDWSQLAPQDIWITHRELFVSSFPWWPGQCSPLAEKQLGVFLFSLQIKKDCVPTYCAAIDFPYFQALGIPKWTPAATPDTDEDIVQAHGHHLFLRCQRRGVSDPSNLRTCVLESIRWTRLRGGRGMSRWIAPFHAIWGQHKYTSETGEISPVFFRPHPFSASAGWDLSLTRIRWAGVAWNDPGSA